jgi:deoxyribonuclease V
MIAAFDVKYFDDGKAKCGAIVFQNFTDKEPYSQYKKTIGSAEDYIPGLFYKRELPCILSLLADMPEKLSTIIIDGYVKLGDQVGLGGHLKSSLADDVTVIGVAKSQFKGASAVEVYRGKSRRPLYVTSAGIDQQDAANYVEQMYGENRIPVLLKMVDHLTRK